MMKRIACIDLGSNAIRFIVYEFRSLLEYQVLYKHRAIVRLGSSVFSKGLLDEKMLSRILEVLFEYQSKARELQVNQVCCVATSAVREASNGKKFLDSINKETDLNFRSLSGSEEARLLALALQWNKPAPANLIYGGVDIGGGSTEIFWYTDQGYVDGISMPIGTVRALENFCEYPLSEKAVGKIRSFVQANSQEFQLRQGTMIPHRVFGISGLLHCIFNLMHKDEEDPLQFQELENFIEQNRRLTPKELEKKFNIEKNRSEILLPGCIILSQLMAVGGFRLIYSAEVGLRDGLAVQQLISEGESFKSLNIHRLRESTIEWSYHLLDKYVGDMPHAQFTDEVITEIFSKLVDINMVGHAETDLLLLRVAGILHDVGQFVSYDKHNEHSTYIIQNSACPFLSERDLTWVAKLSKYHQRGTAIPKLEDLGINDLTESEYQRFTHSVALLRLTDALDRQHRQLLSFRNLKILDDKLVIVTEATDPDAASEELRKFEKNKKLFESVFEKKIILQVDCCSPLH
jgi:exopolyphosphatase / guanosine-5'-triphosphate,3'-diphosphate pyrophosphatase